MSDNVKTFGVPQYRFSPKTSRQKAAVIAGVLLLGYWVSDSGSHDDLPLPVSNENGEGTLGEIQQMLTDLDRQNAESETTSESPEGLTVDSASPDAPQGSTALASATQSQSSSAPSLMIPAIGSPAGNNVMQNASFINSDSSRPSPEVATYESRDQSAAPQFYGTRPAATIRLTGSIQPLN